MKSNATAKTRELAKEIRTGLAAQGTRQRARGTQAYLKSELEFLGVTVPELRRQVKAFARAQKALTKTQLLNLCDSLWSSKVNELRSFAIGLLEQRQAELDASDLPWLIGLIDDADTWAHVDWLAIKVIGPAVDRDPKSHRSLRKWAKHSNFWVRRASLLALHDPLMAGKGHFELFSELASGMLEEKEFLIRKAIGWVLRATARRRPELCIAFVEAHAARMAGLSFKEATRNLPASVQTRLRRLRSV